MREGGLAGLGPAIVLEAVPLAGALIEGSALGAVTGAVPLAALVAGRWRKARAARRHPLAYAALAGRL